MSAQSPEEQNVVNLDPRAADAAYRSFPSFAEWSKCVVDTGRWDRYTNLLASRQTSSRETLKKAREVVKRAAALDTGAIEGLYEVDRGFTFTVATEAALWEAALETKGGLCGGLCNCWRDQQPTAKGLGASIRIRLRCSGASFQSALVAMPRLLALFLPEETV